jgi:tellurite resistance protein TehA-like permease
VTSSERSATPGRWLLRGGTACFLAGLVFVGVVFLPFFAGSPAQPALAAVGTMLAPVGFVLILLGLVRQARANNRAVRAVLAETARR